MCYLRLVANHLRANIKNFSIDFSWPGGKSYADRLLIQTIFLNPRISVICAYKSGCSCHLETGK